MTQQLEGQLTMLDLTGQFGKTYPEPSPQDETERDETSLPSSRRSVTLQAKGVQFLSLKTGNGQTGGNSWQMVSALPGVSMMHRYGYHSGENESTLSQILEEGRPLDKYCLSSRACQGILNRAQKRGKILPEMLRDALLEVVERDQGV